MSEIETELERSFAAVREASPHAQSGNELDYAFGRSIGPLVRKNRGEVVEVLERWLSTAGSGRYEAAVYSAVEFQLTELAPALRARFEDLSAQLSSSSAFEDDLERWRVEFDAQRLKRLLEELEDERVGRVRVELRDAYSAVPAGRFRTPDPNVTDRPRSPDWRALQLAFERLGEYRSSVMRPASEMLGGRHPDRSDLTPDPELREQLAELSGAEENSLSRLAGGYLAEYDAVAHLANVARAMPAEML